METPIQPFNKLLENYLFSAASLCIDQFDDENQTNLIKLIRSIETDSTPLEAVDVDNSSNPIQQLERQWRQILKTPPKRKKVFKKDTFMLEMTQRRIRHYQTIADQTILMIHQIEMGIENITEGNYGLALRVKLIASYTLLLQRNRNYLAVVINHKKIASDRLKQLQA